jgi:dTDP-4-dehydrorhamnose 3,5-epimerase
VKFESTAIPDVIVIEPDVHRDERGFFLETYREESYQAGGIAEHFVQDNHSRSAHGALRGLHAQLEPAQAKLIRVVAGEIWDVAVDIRLGSPTFGQFAAVTLSGENFRQLYIPRGFAHGFCVTSEGADVEYKVTAPYRAEGEIAIAWNDADLAIPWPLKSPALSTRDAGALRVSELRNRLPHYSTPGDGENAG